MRNHAYCAICGKPLVGHCLSRRFRYYQCSSARPCENHGKECRARYVRADDLEAKVWNEIRKVLSDPGAILTEIQSQLAEANNNTNMDSIDSEIQELEKRLGSYEQRRKNLLEALELGEFRKDEVLDRLNNLKRLRLADEDKLEAMVWAELERYLRDRDLIISELERQRQDAGQLGVFESELERIERQLKALDREQHQLLQWALKDFPADQVEAENRRLNKAKDTLKAQKVELEAQLKASQDAVINVPNLERFIKDIQDKLPNLDFDGKRLALDMLGITVWLDVENVEVTGVIEPDKKALRCTSNQAHGLLSQILDPGNTSD